MAEHDERQEVEISNPVLGRLSAKGVRVSDMIGLLVFTCTLGIGFFVYQLGAVAEVHKVETLSGMKQVADAIKAGASAQRLTTCISIFPVEKREQEFTSPNSFCQRMSVLP